MSARHLLFVNGELQPSQALRREVRDSDYIIGVDGGTRHILNLGLRPHVVIGDLDSIDQTLLQQIRDERIPTIEHSPRKDHTDLELAVLHSIERKASELMVVSALGGRFDHMLANILLLGSPALGATPAQIYDGETRAQLLRAGKLYQLPGTPGQTFSLIPLSSQVEVKFLRGAEWDLECETLRFGSSRGLSNLFRGPLLQIQIGSGSVLLVTTAG